MLRAFLVDDEELALDRLSRLVQETGRVEIAGAGSNPVEAIGQIDALRPDLLFLDIEMPELNGFQMLGRLHAEPLVVFTTAYDQYALEAFGVNSIDYLLKPVAAEQLERVLNKIERLRGGLEPRPDLRALLEKLAQPQYPSRVASRTGERIEFVDLARVTHFFSSDKMTFAATPHKNYPVDHTIQELEEKLDPRRWVRVHRSALVNTAFVQELHPWFAGRAIVRLKDERRTEITVARNRLKTLRERLAM